MKKLLLTILCVMSFFVSALAQNGVKRPDSYNYTKGVQAYNDGDYAKSLEYFEKELQANPKNGYAMLCESVIYEVYNKYDQALDFVEKALKYLPKKDRLFVGSAYEGRGRIREALGDNMSALADYERAFKTDGNESHLYKVCGIYNVQGRYEEESKVIERMMKVNGNNVVTWVYAGHNAFSRNMYDKAMECYDYAVRLDPKYSSSFSFRAELYIAMHRYGEASDDAITALGINYDGKAYALLSDIAEEALPVLTAKLKDKQQKEPDDGRWSYYLGMVNISQRKFADAETAFKKAIEIGSHSDKGNMGNLNITGLALPLYELGKYSEAIDVATKSVEADSTNVAVWLVLAHSYYETGQTSSAVDALSRGIKANPKEEILYYWRARMNMYSGALQSALDDINTALEMTGGIDSADLMQRSEIYRRMGKLQEANADCDSIISLQQDLPAYLRDDGSLADAYVRVGQRDKALDVVEKLDKDSVDKSKAYDFACLYSSLDDKQQALGFLEKALQSGFCEFVRIGNDTDLDNIRGTERFKQLVEKYKKEYEERVKATAVKNSDE